MIYLYQHINHSAATNMSKISSSKIRNGSFNKLPRTNFFRTHSFNPYLKKNRRPAKACAAPSINQPSHISDSEAEDTSLPSSSTLEDHESVHKLEKYCVYKAEETTQRINGCVKVAERIREVSSRTLGNIHQQGEQITRTHVAAETIDHELSKSEKILGSLGGLFSRTWKPKKSREIKGPVLSKDDLLMRRDNSMEKRQKLGLNPVRSRSKRRQFLSQKPSSTLQRVEMEKMKQDDALSDLSNLLSELKAMAIDIGSEIEMQNKALDQMEDDVEELNVRVRGANLRARRLLGR